MFLVDIIINIIFGLSWKFSLVDDIHILIFLHLNFIIELRIGVSSRVLKGNVYSLKSFNIAIMARGTTLFIKFIVFTIKTYLHAY